MASPGSCMGMSPTALETGVPLQVGVVQPVVVRLGQGNGPVPVDHLAVGEPAAGIEHGGVDADVVGEVNPPIDADGGKRPFRHLDGHRRVEVVYGRVELVQQRGAAREEPLLELLRHVLGNGFYIFIQVAVAVDDCFQVYFFEHHLPYLPCWFSVGRVNTTTSGRRRAATSAPAHTSAPSTCRRLPIPSSASAGATGGAQPQPGVQGESPCPRKRRRAERAG